MTDFEELVSKLQNGGEELPPTIYDDIRTSYTNHVSSADAKVAELNAAIGEKDELIADLKARNYDLLVSKPATTEPSDDNKNPDESPISGVDSLFGK